jgi:hypothetical protein
MLAAVAFSPVVAASARGRVMRARPLVLHPTFERMTGGWLVASNRYVFVSEGAASAHDGVLIDGETGRHRMVSRPSCSPEAVGGPWVGFACGQGANPSLQLYNVQTGRTRGLVPNPSLGSHCTEAVRACLTIAALGRYWVAFTFPPSDPHLYPTTEFQNLKTGEVWPGSSDSSITTDLDLPGLAVHVCKPVSVPRVSDGYDSGWGSVSFASGFAIAAGGGGSYLERCGSRLHRFLTYTNPTLGYGCAHLVCTPAAASRLIVWQSAAGRLSGMLLPGRKRFTIRVPVRVDPEAASGGFANGDEYRLALTPRRLYLFTIQDRIWSIPTPRQPTDRHSANHRV